MQKALYGMMKSTLQFYWMLVGELRNMGFEINPFNPFVANEMVICRKINGEW